MASSTISSHVSHGVTFDTATYFSPLTVTSTGIAMLVDGDTVYANSALHPEFASCTWETEGCAPLVVCGPKLEAVKQAVAAHANQGTQTVQVSVAQ